LALGAYRIKNNVLNEQRKSLRKHTKVTEERKCVICRANEDGKIVNLFIANGAKGSTPQNASRKMIPSFGLHLLPTW